MHYTRIINNDRVPIDFDIVRKKDREKRKEMHSLLHQWILLKKYFGFVEITQEWSKCVQNTKQEEIQGLHERGVHRTV